MGSLSGAVFGFWVCSFFVPPPPSIAMADLAARDVERGKFAFSIYDFEGNDTMDAFYIGDCLRALNLNPTNAAIEKLGGTKKGREEAQGGGIPAHLQRSQEIQGLRHDRGLLGVHEVVRQIRERHHAGR